VPTRSPPTNSPASGTPRYWLVKSEPFKYSYADLVRDGKTRWDGVRNFEARNALRAMKAGELALYYHSNEGREVVGIIRVITEAYPDPTAPSDEDWSVVDFAPVKQMKAPVSLDQIRGDPGLVDIALLRRSRLSVVPVSSDHFMRILEMGKTTTPRSPAKATSSKPKAASRKA
jgi:predicted RNA-binding protein with PUA-like domain